jgi:hypothetical protein
MTRGSDTPGRGGDVVDTFVTGHRRIALRRRFPDLEIEVRSVSEIEFRLGVLCVTVSRPPFSTWMVSWPFLADVGRYAPAENSEVYALRAMLIEIVGEP